MRMSFYIFKYTILFLIVLTKEKDKSELIRSVKDIPESDIFSDIHIKQGLACAKLTSLQMNDIQKQLLEYKEINMFEQRFSVLLMELTKNCLIKINLNDIEIILNTTNDIELKLLKSITTANVDPLQIFLKGPVSPETDLQKIHIFYVKLQKINLNLNHPGLINNDIPNNIENQNSNNSPINNQEIPKTPNLLYKPSFAFLGSNFMLGISIGVFVISLIHSLFSKKQIN